MYLVAWFDCATNGTMLITGKNKPPISLSKKLKKSSIFRLRSFLTRGS